MLERLQQRCFPVKFAKFLRTTILKNICKQVLLEGRIYCRGIKTVFILLFRLFSGVQSVTGYWGLTLISVWNGPPRGWGGGGWLLLFGGFMLVLAKFSVLRGGWALGYHSMGFRHFSNISQFPKILILSRSPTRGVTSTSHVYK